MISNSESKSLKLFSNLSSKQKLVNVAREQLRDYILKNNKKIIDKNYEKKFLSELEEYDNNHFYVKSKLLEEEIQSILDQILVLIKQNYGVNPDIKILLVDNPEFTNNAYALPNGTILVDLSTLTSIQNIEELWFLITHECAHIVKQHSIVYSNIEALSGKLTNSFFKKTGMDNWFGRAVISFSINQTLEYLKIKKFYKFMRHEDEYEADKIAAEIIASAGMEPIAGGKILSRLAPLDMKSDTHPTTSKRLKRINEIPKGDGPTIAEPFSNDFKNNIENAVEKIRHKRLLIKTSSYMAGSVAAVILIIIYYFAFSFDYSGNAVGNFAFEFYQGFLIRILPYTFILIVPGTFYLIYKKMYRWLKQ